MMSKIAWVFFGLSILYGGASCAKSRFRILNGNLVDPVADNLLFQALLIYQNGRVLCGGTILDEYYVLTAAHCVDQIEAGSITVVVGSNDLESEAGVRHLVSEVIIHEGFEFVNNTFPTNDIALLRLVLPIDFDKKHVAPAALPTSNDRLESGSMAVFSGFGSTNITNEVSARLYKTSVFILRNSACQRAYSPGLIKETNVCTGHPGKSTGFCKGDYGGPLSVKGTVIGVVSFSKGNVCANESLAPQVHTLVSKYVDWINHWRNI